MNTDSILSQLDSDLDWAINANTKNYTGSALLVKLVSMKYVDFIRETI